MSDSPETIWNNACLAMIEEFRLWGYEIRPFIKPVPFPVSSTKVAEQVRPLKVKVKKEFELPGCKGLHYNVLLREDGRSLMLNVNTLNKEQSFWIKDEKLTFIL